MWFSSFRFDCSKDWMNTGEFLLLSPFFLSVCTSGSSSDSPWLSWNVGCFVSG